MTTESLKELGFAAVSEAGEKNIEGGFCGDMLSWVMGRAKHGDCWFTIMANMNTVAVATLADVAAVVLCHGSVLPDEALKKAREENVNVFYTELPVYEAAVRFRERFASDVL